MGPFFTPPQVTRLKINFCLSTPRMDQSAKKKVERSRRVFWQLHAIFWTTIVEAPIIFVIKIFFFYVGGCLLLLLLCNLIWHSVLLTMRFWWTYTTIGSAKNATRHGNLFVIQNVNENDISGVRVNKPKTYTVSKWCFLIVGNKTPKYPAYLTSSRIPPIYSTESVPVVSSVFYVFTGLMLCALINYLQTPSTKIAFTFSRS